MFRTLLRKELHANLLSPRLRVPAVCGVAIAVGATLLGTLDFARNMRVYEREAASVERALEEATVYSQVQHRVVVPPQAPGPSSAGGSPARRGRGSRSAWTACPSPPGSWRRATTAIS